MTSQPGARFHLVLAGSGHALLWIIVAAVALGLVVVLSRYELRLVSRRAGAMLLASRMLALFLLLAALFEPIAERRYQEKVRGRVVLGVDLSESMATADPSPARDDHRLSASEPEPTVSRRDVARGLLEGDWLKRIVIDHTLESVGFARDATVATPGALAKVLHNPAAPRDPAFLATDWSGVLGRALEGGESGPVLGVVLLTDGRQNHAADAGRQVERLAARGIPIYPVMIGSSEPPLDVAIAEVKAPQSVLKGDLANVEVVVKADVDSGREIPVTLERQGGPPLKELVQRPADGSRPIVRFRVPLLTVGAQDLSVSVGPLGGDVRPDNDRRAVRLQVADDKARVLLVDGEARWEFRYVYNALKRDPRVAVEAVVFRQPHSSASTETYKNALPPAPRAGQIDPLGGYDAILVGDVEPGLLSFEAWARFEAFVARRGGSLILSSGPRAYPAAILAVDSARKLLPVLDPSPVSFDAQAIDPAHPILAAGVTIRPAATAAETWPMLQFGATPELSRAVWEGLPRLPWALAGRAKPGAATLAIVEGSGPGVAAAVIAAQPYGLGKVLWIGTDSTWRWRYRVGDLYHHRFWGQVMRWAAAAKLASGNDWVRFGPERSELPEGEGARLVARFADGIAGVSSDELVVVRIYTAASSRGQPPKAEGGAVAIVPLHGVPGQPRTFAANAPVLATGRYVVRLEATRVAEAASPGAAAAAAPPEATLEITPRQTSELVELSAARDPLDRLAAATGGRVLTASDVDQLPDILHGRQIKKIRSEETTLWDRPWALVLFFGALTFEWVLRKRVGLP
jgi:hypothetical protein